MSDLFEQWVQRVRETAAIRTASAEDAIKHEISDLQKSLSDLGDFDRLSAMRRDLEVSVGRLQTEYDRLKSQVVAAEQEIHERRRRQAVADLDCVEMLLDSHRTRIDLETIEAAADILQGAGDPMLQSPEQLRRILESKASATDEIRRKLQEEIEWATTEARKERDLVVKANELQAQLTSAEAHAEDLRRELLERHQVELPVIEGLRRISPSQKRLLLDNFITPRTNDGRLETQWMLPYDVLREANGGQKQ